MAHPLLVPYLPMMSVLTSTDPLATMDSLASPVAQGACVHDFHVLDGLLATTERRVPPNTSSHARLCVADSLRVSDDQLI